MGDLFRVAAVLMGFCSVLARVWAWGIFYLMLENFAEGREGEEESAGKVLTFEGFRGRRFGYIGSGNGLRHGDSGCDRVLSNLAEIE